MQNRGGRFWFSTTMVTKTPKDFEEEKGQNDNGEGFFNFLMEEMKEENEMYQETLYLPNSQTHSIVDEEVYLTNNYQESLVYNNLAINNFADFQEVEQVMNSSAGISSTVKKIKFFRFLSKRFPF